MRKLGLIGGLSWTSTARYYELINRSVQRRMGGLHSATLLVESLDFAEVARCVTGNDWDCALSQMAGAAKRLELAGAEGLPLCAHSKPKRHRPSSSAGSSSLLNVIDTRRPQPKAPSNKSVAGEWCNGPPRRRRAGRPHRPHGL